MVRLERPPPWSMGMIVLVTILAMGLVCYQWWKARALGIEAREQAMPACVEQLGEEACRAHMKQHHEDCARLTLVRPQRTTPGPMRMDAQAYLRCVVLGVDEWVAENGRRHEAGDRARTVPLP